MKTISKRKIPNEDEFYFVENGINKGLYMSIIECVEPTGYELKVVSCDYDDYRDDIDRKNSIVQFVYPKQVSWTGKVISEAQPDNHEFYTNKSKCRKRFNQLVKEIKN